MGVKVYLVGVGMGNADTLTVEARAVIESCQALVGAPRLLEHLGQRAVFPMISPDEIANYIRNTRLSPIGVLLSGDVGFYSGAAVLRDKLKGYDVESVAGISSISYFCAKLGISWQDIHVVSVHGRERNFIGEIQSHGRTFLLTGGKLGASDICRELAVKGLGYITVTVGERLSYSDELITRGTAESLMERRFEGLAVVLVENSELADKNYLFPGIPDDKFYRGGVPMTKEEIRTIVLSKLRLRPEHILWDVGAGTGSVSVESALALTGGAVHAIEKNTDAIYLLEANREKFRVCNLNIVHGEAPEALYELPKPDRVFLGGTSGKFNEILELAFERNPALRCVVTAITLETLSAAVKFMENRNLCDIDIVQVAVTHTRLAGKSHMMSAANPVWIISGEGRG